MVGVPLSEKKHGLEQACPSFHIVRAIAAKSGLYGAKIKFGIQNAGRVSIRTFNSMDKVMCLFYYTLIFLSLCV